MLSIFEKPWPTYILVRLRAYSCYSLLRISEWELLPCQEIYLLPIQVYYIFLTRSTTCPKEWLFGKHSVIFMVTMPVHDNLIQVLKLFLQEFDCLLCVILVS